MRLKIPLQCSGISCSFSRTVLYAELLNRYRTRVVKALETRHVKFAEHVSHFCGFHAFHAKLRIKSFRQLRNELHRVPIFFIRLNVQHVIAVNFHTVDRELAQNAERRKSCAEIVQSDSHSFLTKAHKNILQQFHIEQATTFCEFKTKILCWEMRRF